MSPALILAVTAFTASIAYWLAIPDTRVVERLARYADTGQPLASEPTRPATPWPELGQTVADALLGLYPARVLEEWRGSMAAAGLSGRHALGLFLASKAALTVVGALLGLMLKAKIGLVWAIALPLLGWVGPTFYLRSRTRKRQQAIARALPDTLDLLTACVEAGLGLDAAIHQLLKRPGSTKTPLGVEFTRYLQSLQLGLARSDALRQLGTNSGVPELKQLSNALVQGDALGIGISQILRAQTGHMRITRKQRAEALAMQAPVKILFPLLFGIFPSIFVIVLGPAILRLMDAFALPH